MLNNFVYLLNNFIFLKRNLLFSVLSILSLVMILDYITGMLAAKKEGLDHPNNKKYGWSSKKSIKGIYKKVGYIVIVLVATITDYLIYAISVELGFTINNSQTFFGIIVSIWLIINELLSVLENSGRMGAQLPEFLTKVLSELKKTIEDDNLH